MKSITPSNVNFHVDNNKASCSSMTWFFSKTDRMSNWPSKKPVQSLSLLVLVYVDLVFSRIAPGEKLAARSFLHSCSCRINDTLNVCAYSMRECVYDGNILDI